MTPEQLAKLDESLKNAVCAGDHHFVIDAVEEILRETRLANAQALAIIARNKMSGISETNPQWRLVTWLERRATALSNPELCEILQKLEALQMSTTDNSISGIEVP